MLLETDSDEEPDPPKGQKRRHNRERSKTEIVIRDHICSDSRRPPDRYACIQTQKQTRNKPKDTLACARVKLCALLTCVNMSHPWGRSAHTGWVYSIYHR